MGTLAVSIYNATDSSHLRFITTETIINGTTRITLPDYYPDISVTVGGSDFYLGSSASGTVQYNLADMIQTQGPAGSDPVTNAKWTIIKNYVENSGAFTYDSATGNYTMNTSDNAYTGRDTVYNVERGYEVILSTPISQQELDGNQFDDQNFTVTRYWASGGTLGQSQERTNYTLAKMDFFNLWPGQKLQPTSYGGDQPAPSGFTRLDSLANDFATFLSKDQSYFQTDSGAKDFSAKVQGLLTKATSEGFPTPKGGLEQLADFVNGIISTFMDAINSIWNAIVSFVGTVVNFVMTVWNNIVGPVLGAVIEAVKSVVTILFNQILNIVVQPMLSGQQTSLENLFDGNSYDSIMTGVSSIITEFGNGLDQSLSQVAQIGQMTQTLYAAGSILDGAGTILEPLIIIAGPGIVATLFDLIGSKIVDFLITPLIDQFTSSVLESFLNDISAGFGSPENLVNQASVQNQKSTDFLIRGKIGTQQYETQQYGPIHPEGSYCSLNDIGCQISDLLGGLIDFVNQIGNAILNEVINPFIATIEMIISGLLKIYGELLDPANRLTVVIGMLSVIDDLLGGFKSKVPSSAKPIIQWARLTIESFQTNIALYKLLTSVNSNYYYDGLNSFFWVVKSANSLVSDSLSFISDLFYYIPTLETSIGQILGSHLNGKTVKQYLYDLRAKSVLVSVGINLLVLSAKDIIFPSLHWSNPLTESQFKFALAFAGPNFIESVAKYLLYSKKASDKPIGNNTEFYIYVGGAVFDGAQTIASVMGII